MSIHGFWILASSILTVLLILLENDVFKLLIYLDIYIFVCGYFARPKCWGISFKDAFYRSIYPEVFIDNLCKQDWSNSYFKIDGWPHASLEAALTLLKMFNSIFKAFSDMLRVSKIVSLKSWLHFGFGIKTTRGFPSSTYSTFEQLSSVLWKS